MTHHFLFSTKFYVLLGMFLLTQIFPPAQASLNSDEEREYSMSRTYSTTSIQSVSIREIKGGWLDVEDTTNQTKEDTSLEKKISSENEQDKKVALALEKNVEVTTIKKNLPSLEEEKKEDLPLEKIDQDILSDKAFNQVQRDDRVVGEEKKEINDLDNGKKNQDIIELDIEDSNKKTSQKKEGLKIEEEKTKTKKSWKSWFKNGFKKTWSWFKRGYSRIKNFFKNLMCCTGKKHLKK